MRNGLLAVLMGLAWGPLALAQSPPDFDWSLWRHMPVQDGGRYKPLDSLAWETLRLLCNRGSFPDPETGQRLEPTAWYVTMVLESLELGRSPHASLMGQSASSQQGPDKWDRAPLLRVDDLRLREALGMAADQKYISPTEVAEAQITDPKTGRSVPFMEWARQFQGTKRRALPPFERKAAELADALQFYREHRRGLRMGLVPAANAEDDRWLSIGELVSARFTDQNDPSGQLRRLQGQLLEVREAFRGQSVERFNEASAALGAMLAEVGPEQGTYPAAWVIDLEVAYNHWVPFRFAWVLTTLAFASSLLGMGTGRRGLYRVAVLAFVAGLVAMLVGFGMRIAISGRAPVTNMYESVVYLALGTAVFGLAFEWFYRSQYVLAAASAVSTVALILADNCPAVLDPSLQPLTPVLRSNFWLVTHVMSITLSYAAFALALGIGNITLGYYLAGSRREDTIAALTRFTYRALQVGVLLLAAGTILGGVWADYAWGRFWGWDPKEVWALIALLGYLAVLHARYVGWVGNLGLAALSVLCFSLVVMAWYGVNFVLGAGLHSYGFGGGGQPLVFSAIAAQCLYVGIAVLAARARSAPA